MVVAASALYTLSLHAALPISDDADDEDSLLGSLPIKPVRRRRRATSGPRPVRGSTPAPTPEPDVSLEESDEPDADREAETDADREAETDAVPSRSEEHTSELQSRGHLVCRLLPENK